MIKYTGRGIQCACSCGWMRRGQAMQLLLVDARWQQLVPSFATRVSPVGGKLSGPPTFIQSFPFHRTAAVFKLCITCVTFECLVTFVTALVCHQFMVLCETFSTVDTLESVLDRFIARFYIHDDVAVIVEVSTHVTVVGVVAFTHFTVVCVVAYVFTYVQLYVLLLRSLRTLRL